MRDIPTVGGPSLPLLSYIGALRSLTNAVGIIKAGYAKVSLRAGLVAVRGSHYPCLATQYKGRCFRYAELGHWRVLVTSPEAVEELAKAPEDVLSFHAASIDVSHLAHPQSPSDAKWARAVDPDPVHLGPRRRAEPVPPPSDSETSRAECPEDVRRHSRRGRLCVLRRGAVGQGSAW